MPNRNFPFDSLLAAALLIGLALVWWVSAWNMVTTAIVSIVVLAIAVLIMAHSTSLRRMVERSEKQSIAAIRQTEERRLELESGYESIEDELATLRNKFDETEQVKRSFLANISHEIRTPMNGIFGMTELLGQTPLNTKQKWYTDSISRSTESLLNIVNDVLDFSSIQNGQLKLEYSNFLLTDLIEDVCDLYAESAQKMGIEIISDVSEIGGITVRGDSTRVRQILHNLVSNALKFTEKGEILISSMPTDKEDFFEFFVKDTGIGISAATQDLIFKEFTQADGSTTRRFGGTGLGLTIANNLSNLMNGELTVTSEVGVGSTFSFTCQLYLADSLNDSNQKQMFSSVRALVVDDNNTNSAILVHQLEQWGVKAISVDSGVAALKTLQDATTDKEPFDIAILDLHMPQMDGFELASHIQNNVNYNTLRMMMLTSSLTNMTSDELQGIGISCALTKPARQASLYNAIAGLIGNNHTLSPSISDTGQSTGLNPDAKKPRILLTEDNPINQEVASVMLEQIGCEVVIAENGSEALSALAENFYDLVFMDCQMPVMDGFEATRSIRKKSNQKDIPVVALTANAMDGDKELCLSSGMNDYLSKPVNQGELERTIEKWLAQTPTISNHKITSKPTTIEASESMNFEFDENALDAIKALQRPGKPDILARIVNMYLDKTPELIDDIKGGIAANDAARVKMAAHTLKSSSAYLGATTLADQCNKLEAKAANDDLADGQEHISVIRMGFNAISEKIKPFA